MLEYFRLVQMSEEGYYIDILNEDNDKPAKKDDYSWGSESYPPEEKPPDFYQEDFEEEPYQQEFYGEGVYQDYQTQPPPPQRPAYEEHSKKWFWLGVLTAAGLSAIIMVVFNFIGTSHRPGLAYLETVLLLLCTTIPGLFVRKVGKGILGGMMIFGLQFFAPIIFFYALGKNPTSFFSPYFLFLNAVGLILNGYSDLKSFSFFPIDPTIFDQIDQYTGYAAFVWVFDLLIMFGVMITLVIASSWLTSNLFTSKVKNVWTWCLLPIQAIVIILNLVVVPWVLLSLSSTVQTGGALAAGAGNIAEGAMPLISGNFTDMSDADFNALLERLDRADMWFQIARGNYRGLSSLRFFNLLRAVSGSYGFIVDMFNSTIAAGFELLAAISPLAHGMFDNSTTTPGAEVDGFFYQYKEFMDIYKDFPTSFDFNGNGTKPSESDLAQMEVEVGDIINDVELLLELHFREVIDHVLRAEEILLSIDPDDLRDVSGIEQVNQVLNQVADQLDMVMNITNEYSALIPIAVDLLFETPSLLRALFSMFVGNVRLLMGWQFDQSQTYFQNATLELANVQAIFSAEKRAEIVASESETALGFFDFFADVLNLATPIIAYEGALAGTLGNIVAAVDEYETDGVYPPANCTMGLVNFTAVFDYMNQAITFADIGVVNATDATNMMTLIETRGNNSEYSLMSAPAYQLVSTINGVFQPEPFARVISNISRAINATFGTTYAINSNNEPLFSAELDTASSNINASIDVIDSYSNGTPIYALRDFLVTFRDSINNIKEAVQPFIGSGTINLAVPDVEDIMEALITQIHNIVDQGLPP